MSTRSGGVSHAPWDSLNLGDHVGDNPEAVAANRLRLQQALGARPVFLRQVHGTAVLELRSDTLGGEADACFTFAPGVACTIQVADCLPVLLWDRQGQWVAAAHAGWRGLAGAASDTGEGVLEALVAHFDPAHTLAWLGPCIGPQAFEVGADVRAAFLRADPEAEALFVPAAADAGRAPGAGAKWFANLPGLARRRLAALGAKIILKHDRGNIEGADAVVVSTAVKGDNPEVAAARAVHATGYVGTPSFLMTILKHAADRGLGYQGSYMTLGAFIPYAEDDLGGFCRGHAAGCPGHGFP